jgi:hypothetical protein
MIFMPSHARPPATLIRIESTPHDAIVAFRMTGTRVQTLALDA